MLQVYMTGGAGYVLSMEAARLFVTGQGDQGRCRPGDRGPEDVEMSRCLQRLGVSFVDTRDKYGRDGIKLCRYKRKVWQVWDKAL